MYRFVGIMEKVRCKKIAAKITMMGMDEYPVEIAAFVRKLVNNQTIVNSSVV